MLEIRHTAVVDDVPRDRVFDYINGYENVPKFMFGITKFDPITEATSGLGSRFKAALNVGPKTLTSTAETTAWVENELIELTAVEGFSVNTTWRFADHGDGGTSVDVHFAYNLPGGLAGRALKIIIEPFAAQAVKATEANLREQVR